MYVLGFLLSLVGNFYRKSLVICIENFGVIYWNVRTVYRGYPGALCMGIKYLLLYKQMQNICISKLYYITPTYFAASAQSSIHPTIDPSFHPSNHPSIRPSIHPSIHPSNHLSTKPLNPHLPNYVSNYLPTHPPTQPPTYLSTYLSIYLSNLSIYLSISLYVCICWYTK